MNDTTSQQLERNRKSAWMLAGGMIFLLVIGSLEFLAWHDLANGQLTMQVALGALAIMNILGSPLLLWAKPVALKEGRGIITLEIIFFGSSVLTLFSILIFLHGHFAMMLENVKKGGDFVVAAKAAIASAEAEYDNLLNSLPFSYGDVQMAAEDRIALDAQIAKVEAQSLEQNKIFLEQRQNALNVFFDTTDDQTALKVREILDVTCTPLPSPFGGGLMISAAKRLCPKLKSILAANPIRSLVDNSLDEKRRELDKRIAWANRLANAEEKKKQATDNYNDSLKNEKGADKVTAIFILIADLLNTKTENVMAVFAGLVVLFVRMACFTLLDYSSKVKTIATYKSQQIGTVQFSQKKRQQMHVSKKNSLWDKLRRGRVMGNRGATAPIHPAAGSSSSTDPVFEQRGGSIGFHAKFNDDGTAGTTGTTGTTGTAGTVLGTALGTELTSLIESRAVTVPTVSALQQILRCRRSTLVVLMQQLASERPELITRDGNNTYTYTT